MPHERLKSENDSKCKSQLQTSATDPDSVLVTWGRLKLVEARGRGIVRLAVGEGVERQAADGVPDKVD